MKHLLLLALLLSSTYGIALEDLKGPLAEKALNVPEATTVPFPVYQFVSVEEGVTAYRVSGDLQGISMSAEGWLYLTEPLTWSADKHTYTLQIEALLGDATVDGPFEVVLTVLDTNNHAPDFNQDLYNGEVMEHKPAGTPFVQVRASDADDPGTVNSALWYSIVREIPSTADTSLFQIDPQSGEISTTEDGARLLKARSELMYSRGEQRGSREVLEKKFDDFCTPVNDIPYDKNPFFTCVLRRESRSVDATADPDYTLIVRAEDMGGGANALSSTTRVNVFVRQNLWVNPGLITLRENLKGAYPMRIATVTANDPNAIYTLTQKERLNFPFTIDADGQIFVTEELDREDRAMYTLVVFARDEQGVELERPMEIHVTVTDENDNAPECGATEFEVQENEVVGSPVGSLNAHDADDEDTANALLTYTLLSQSPAAESMFSIEGLTGEVKVTRSGLRRSVIPQYTLTFSVSDSGIPAKSVECTATIRVIDVNNELPIFEKNDYGKVGVAENAELGDVLLSVKANDADDPGTGSSKVVYSIGGGDPDGIFTMVTDDETGEGKLAVSKPLDFESKASYVLQIHARNPEPLMKGLEYGKESSATVVVDVENVDEAPEFDMDVMSVSVPENLTVGATILKIEARDPEGKEIMYKLEGDERGWLQIDSATGELKTKAALDYEAVQDLTVKVIVYEKGVPDMQAEREVNIHLTDVNDNIPKLVGTDNAFICASEPKKPILLRAVDADAEPFGAPFTFSIGSKNKRSPNWDLKQQDETTALLTLKKAITGEETIGVPINIKDNTGMGITHKLEVKLCNCTEFGACFVDPGHLRGVMTMGETIGILGGVLGFIVIVMIIAVKQSKKKSKRNINEGEDNVMLS